MSLSNIERGARDRAKNSERIKASDNKRYADNPQARGAVSSRAKKKKPKLYAYLGQRQCAKQRGIEWLFDFATWVAWWGEDFALRGKKSNELVMARHGDIGPYHPDNVIKMPAGQNVSEARRKQYGS